MLIVDFIHFKSFYTELLYCNAFTDLHNCPVFHRIIVSFFFVEEPTKEGGDGCKSARPAQHLSVLRQTGGHRGHPEWVQRGDWHPSPHVSREY